MLGEWMVEIDVSPFFASRIIELECFDLCVDGENCLSMTFLRQVGPVDVYGSNRI